MQYLLVQNRTTVLLGPIDWRPRFIQSELNDLMDSGDLTVKYTVPSSEQGYVNIGDGIEIFPVNMTIPAHDLNYQYLSGPFYTYDSTNVAQGTYTVNDLDINSVKSNLKQVVAAQRYIKQISGTTVTVANTTFSVGTDTDTLNQFVSLSNATGINTINYKSPNGFISVTGTDIQSIVNQINTYIQEQFTWEMTTGQAIDAASDVTTLQTLVTGS